MEYLTPMPRRRMKVIDTEQKKEYSYRDIVEQNIPMNKIWSIRISSKDLDCDMSLLRNICAQNNGIDLCFTDYESVLYVDQLLENKINNAILVNDGKRISREYIDLTRLKNIALAVPLDYLVWGVKFNDTVKTYCFQTQNEYFTSFGCCANGNESLSKNNLILIKKAIEDLAKNNPKDSIEKMCLISDFIQSRTQFIHGYYSTGRGQEFITPWFPEKCSDTGLVETVLNKRRGVCVGIANLSTLLLNNPEFNVEVESVYGSHHAWNKILIDGKYYYFDNTWNITRSENPYEHGLITLSFSKNHLLFGEKKAQSIGSHERQSSFVYNNGVLSEEDYNKAIEYTSRFPYQEKPKYYSYKKK